jgi:predicted RNA-binding Zn-ribbon protein involved in translation (DUF1610 family)
MTHVKARIRSQAAPAVTSWWLGDGDEECPHCGQLYIYQVEYRCPDCDSPVCPRCKTQHVQGHYLCPDCARKAAGQEL